MIEEIRIYYECLEQAYHYLRDIIFEELKKLKKEDTSIKLVKRPKNFKSNTKTTLGSIYSITTPDFLITGVKNSVEIPLIIGEFSESVMTEDHELQRATGTIAALLSDSIYLKISGEKISDKEHGGMTEFNPLTVARILKEEFDYENCFIDKWPTKKDSLNVLDKNADYLSCPKRGSLPLSEKIIQNVIEKFILLNDKKSIIDSTIAALKKEPEYKQYIKNIKKGWNLEELEKDWKRRDTGSSRTRYFVDNSVDKIKLYRFGHAMDPDRGILLFTSFILTKKKKIYGIYPLKNVNSKQELFSNFKRKLEKDGLAKWFEKDILLTIKNNLTKDSVDITQFWVKNKDKWKNNKVLNALAIFSDGLYIEDYKRKFNILLTWDRSKIAKKYDKNNFGNFLKDNYQFKYERPVPLKIVKNEIGEDEVTYIVVHQILKPQGFNIISVSYPGAQGDVAILPDKEKGRSQERKYLDIIAWYPKNKNDLIIEENKGTFQQSEIEEAIEYLTSFKYGKNLKALKDAITRVNTIQDKIEVKRILIGVGFGIDSNTKITWEPAKVDFIVRISEMKKWDIGVFDQKLRDVIKKVSGNVRLPELYLIDFDNIGTSSLSNFF